MTEAAVTRYLIAKGWQLIEEGWFSLCGLHENPVCIETAFHLQKRLELAAA